VIFVLFFNNFLTVESVMLRIIFLHDIGYLCDFMFRLYLFIWRWAVVSPDGVAPSRMVSVSASVNLPLHHKVQKFSSGSSPPRWSRKKGHKTVVVWCGIILIMRTLLLVIRRFKD